MLTVYYIILYHIIVYDIISHQLYVYIYIYIHIYTYNCLEVAERVGGVPALVHDLLVADKLGQHSWGRCKSKCLFFIADWREWYALCQKRNMKFAVTPLVLTVLYTYIYIYIYIYVYLYIDISLSLSLYIYIYIYMLLCCPFPDLVDVGALQEVFQLALLDGKSQKWQYIICSCILIYIYIYTERERDVCVYIYIYIHTYTYTYVNVHVYT